MGLAHGPIVDREIESAEQFVNRIDSVELDRPKRIDKVCWSHKSKLGQEDNGAMHKAINMVATTICRKIGAWGRVQSVYPFLPVLGYIIITPG